WTFAPLSSSSSSFWRCITQIATYGGWKPSRKAGGVGPATTAGALVGLASAAGFASAAGLAASVGLASAGFGAEVGAGALADGAQAASSDRVAPIPSPRAWRRVT